MSAIAGACFIASVSPYGEALSRRLDPFLTLTGLFWDLIYAERFGAFAFFVVVAGSRRLSLLALLTELYSHFSFLRFVRLS